MGSWKCSAGGDCVLPLVKSAKFCFHVRPQLCALTHPVIHLCLGPQKPDPPFPLAAGETEVQRRVWMSQGDIDHVMSLRGQYLNSRLTSPGQHLPLEPPAWGSLGRSAHCDSAPAMPEAKLAPRERVLVCSGCGGTQSGAAFLALVKDGGGGEHVALAVREESLRDREELKLTQE